VTEWDQRELCPDGACVGVIGPSGTCKTCGRAAANWGDERNRGLTPLPPPEPSDSDVVDDGDDDYDDDDDIDDDDLPDPPALSAEDDPEWNERKVCSDGACIGVIGDDGRCKVCGSAAA
jgi:hypothetical protein